NGDSVLTANLTGRIVTVANTTGFVADGMVVFDQDADNDNYGTSRIRKILSLTQVELYHGLDGFTTTTPARMVQVDAARFHGLRTIVRVGSEWWFYPTNFQYTYQDGTAYGMLCEQVMLYTHANAAPSGATPVINHLASPVIPRGFNSDMRSVENMTLLMPPVIREQLLTPTPTPTSTPTATPVYANSLYLPLLRR